MPENTRVVSHLGLSNKYHILDTRVTIALLIPLRYFGTKKSQNSHLMRAKRGMTMPTSSPHALAISGELHRGRLSESIAL